MYQNIEKSENHSLMVLKEKKDTKKYFAIKIKIISICLILEEVLEKVYTGDEAVEQLIYETAWWKWWRK